MNRPHDLLLSVDGLTAGYGSRVALRDASFEVRAGERVAILGPNGGGKTTLLRTLIGDLTPLGGRITTEGGFAAVPQTDRSRLDFPVSALDVVLMGCLPALPWWRRPGRRERVKAKAALEKVGLAEVGDRSFGELSGGQRQRVLIARELVQEAPILLLDEPFVGLDRNSAASLEGLIARLARDGHALLIATHDLSQARRWEKVLCLNGTQIAFGRPDTVLDRETLQLTYGGEIIDIPGGGSLLPAHHHEECSRS